MRPSVRVLLTYSVVSLPILTGVPRSALAQSFPSDDPVIRQIWEEGVERSQVYELGQVMMDSIGPRLTGSPAMAAANDWAVAKYAQWGIDARKEQYGTWRGWERGISHIDLVSPRVRSLEGMAAAWSPATDAAAGLVAASAIPAVRRAAQTRTALAPPTLPGPPLGAPGAALGRGFLE